MTTTDTNSRRMYDALKRIASYESPEKLRKIVVKMYGLEPDEANRRRVRERHRRSKGRDTRNAEAEVTTTDERTEHVHIAGSDDGELHEPHTCAVCSAECDGDSPCRLPAPAGEAARDEAWITDYLDSPTERGRAA